MTQVRPADLRVHDLVGEHHAEYGVRGRVGLQLALVSGGRDHLAVPDDHEVENNYAGDLDEKGTPPELSPTPDMQRDRWYPTAVRLPDKSILVAGHGFNPVAVPDSAQTRERCDVDDVAGTVTWRSYAGAHLLNNLSGSGCGVESLVDLQVYPRMHQLVSGDLFASLSETEILSFDTCPDPSNPDRWSIIQASVHPAPDAATVHYIDLTPEAGPAEVIYTLGGSVEGTHTLASNRVLRMDVNIANAAACRTSPSSSVLRPPIRSTVQPAPKPATSAVTPAKESARPASASTHSAKLRSTEFCTPSRL